jgi:iron complex transport system permease protein
VSAASAPIAAGVARADRRGRLVLPGVLLGLVALVGGGLLLSLAVGGHGMTLTQILEALQLRWQSQAWADSPEATIIWSLRLPRSVLAVLVGANLAVAGVLLQGIMRNPLAAPDIVGVTAGAGLAATINIVLVPSAALGWNLGAFALPAAAFAGAMVAAAAVFALSWQPGVGTSPVRMVLAGVAVSAMVGGRQSFLMVQFSDRVQGVVLWLAGSFSTRSWHHVLIVGPSTLIGLVLAGTLVRPLNLLQLGEPVAQSLGVPINWTRVLSITAASLLTGAAVCAVGIIGFVGLVVPHIMRLLVGHQHRRLIPAAALGGAALVLWADIAARALGEMPAGVLTAMIGGPYFVALLYKRKLI